MKKQLFLTDMTNAGNVNGVTRCVELLAESLAHDSSFDVFWVRFVHNLSGESKVKVVKGYTLVLIPLPADMGLFLRDGAVRLSCWRKASEFLIPFLVGSPVLHIHTLNLIEFALFLRRQVPCKIVTHLHCLPWKGLYNTDVKLFNLLFEQYYVRKDYSNPSLFIRQEYERLAYTKSDCLVCVTECARDFISRICPGHTDVQVVTNGIPDMALTTFDKVDHKPLRCLFVGSSHTSKGLWLVLTAMQGALIQYPVSLTIAGAIPRDMRNNILNRFPFLDIHFTGQVEFARLRQIYADSDVGLIGSVQEQCSYVAIEMMMMGLPVVTTDVDGLDELFTDGYNGIKVPVHFHPRLGLQVDVIRMSEAIVTLGRNAALRRRLGMNARRQFQERHSLQQMTDGMKAIYKSLVS